MADDDAAGQVETTALDDPSDPDKAANARRRGIRDAQEADPEAVARAAANKELVSQAADVDQLDNQEPGLVAVHGDPLAPSTAKGQAAQALELESAESDGADEPAATNGAVVAEAADANSEPDGSGETGSDAAVRAPEPGRQTGGSYDASGAANAPLVQPPGASGKGKRGSGRMAWLFGRGGRGRGEGPLTVIPDYDTANWEQLEFYPLEADVSYVRILRQRTTGEMLYEAIEPALTPTERQALAFVEDALVRGLDTDAETMDAAARQELLLTAVRQIFSDYKIRVDELGQARIEYYLRRDFLGLGTIHPVMVDPNIEDISCNGAAQPIFLFHRRFESLRTNVRFEGEEQLSGFVVRLAQQCGKAISIADPVLDAALPDGSRLQATLGHEVTQNGSTFTIRRFKPDPFTPLDLVGFGTVSRDMLAWFWMIVQAGQSLIFSGGTASGKTTGLNAISQFIPPLAKIVSIEDTREVNLPHPNWIKATTRTGSKGEGTAEIGMFELLKASLRQRPEYILVGEVRGIEATVAFQAMATGHTVYSTMHADSARSVVYRLENEPINVPRLVLQALDVIAIQAQTRHKGKRVRRVMEVVELIGMDPETKELLTNQVFQWDPATDTQTFVGRSYMLERIAARRNWTAQQTYAELERRSQVIGALMERGVKDTRELAKVITAYYRDPDGTAAALGVSGGP